MPQRVINPFKQVEIQKHHGQRVLMTMGIGQCQLQPVEKHPPVRQPGKFIHIGQLMDFLFLLFALGNITEDRGILGNPAIFSANGCNT